MLVSSKSSVPVYPLFQKNRDRNDNSDGLVSPADGGGRAHCRGTRLLDVQKVQPQVFILCVIQARYFFIILESHNLSFRRESKKLSQKQ